MMILSIFTSITLITSVISDYHYKPRPLPGDGHHTRYDYKPLPDLHGHVTTTSPPIGLHGYPTTTKKPAYGKKYGYKQSPAQLTPPGLHGYPTTTELPGLHGYSSTTTKKPDPYDGKGDGGKYSDYKESYKVRRANQVRRYWAAEAVEDEYDDDDLHDDDKDEDNDYDDEYGLEEVLDDGPDGLADDDDDDMDDGGDDDDDEGEDSDGDGVPGLVILPVPLQPDIGGSNPGDYGGDTYHVEDEHYGDGDNGGYHGDYGEDDDDDDEHEEEEEYEHHHESHEEYDDDEHEGEYNGHGGGGGGDGYGDYGGDGHSEYEHNGHGGGGNGYEYGDNGGYHEYHMKTTDDWYYKTTDSMDESHEYEYIKTTDSHDGDSDDEDGEKHEGESGGHGDESDEDSDSMSIEGDMSLDDDDLHDSSSKHSHSSEQTVSIQHDDSVEDESTETNDDDSDEGVIDDGLTRDTEELIEKAAALSASSSLFYAKWSFYVLIAILLLNALAITYCIFRQQFGSNIPNSTVSEALNDIYESDPMISSDPDQPRIAGDDPDDVTEEEQV